MNWQKTVKLLRDIFTYAYVQIVVYTLKENAVHAMCVEGDVEFYADDEIERCSENFFFENREQETDFEGRTPNPVNRFVMNNFVFCGKDHNKRLIDHYPECHPKKLTNYVEEFDFQYSDGTDGEMIPLIDMFVDARDV